jgi:hypothetical protein
MALGLMQPAKKAAERRGRIAIFGGAQNETQGRRNQPGKVFNRRKPTGPVGPAAVVDKGYTTKDAWGRDYTLNLNDGVQPEGNLWSTFTPDINPYTGEYSSQGANPRPYDYGTLSTGARGYFDPATGKWMFEDSGNSDDSGD